ncbi:hypothetical protein MRX96_040297 [Rhipicephalus microplus]
MQTLSSVWMDKQCTPSTTTEALDSNQADKGKCSPMMNGEGTEMTNSSTSEAETGDSNVSGSFNATDLGTADVDDNPIKQATAAPAANPRAYVGGVAAVSSGSRLIVLPPGAIEAYISQTPSCTGPLGSSVGSVEHA